MESLINNPGFNNITKKIFLLLDHQTLITCRLVCQSLKTKVEDPYFWIKRCSQLGQPKSLTNSWTDLVQRHKKSWLIKDIKVEAKNCRDRKTLWHLRKRFLEQKFVQCLIKWTLNFSHLELGGFDPLHAAALFGCLEVVEFITSYTENVNPSWMLYGCTPLHLAAKTGHTNVVEILASKMENVNIKDNLGDTPLHIAAGNGQINVVLSLANKVDNLNSMNNVGDTPLHLAAFNGHAKIVEFLVSKIDNPNLIDNVGLSAYELAVREAKFEVVEILHPYNNYWPTIPFGYLD